MKLNDIKHNHSLTDLLKILIFAILMMIPFIDVSTRCLYVICNKNAYQSYANYNQATTQYDVISTYSLVEGNTYRFISNNTENSDLKTTTNGSINVENITIISSTLSSEINTLITNSTNFYLYKYNNNTYFKSDLMSSTINFSSNSLIFTFRYLNYLNVNETNTFNYYFDNCIYSNNLEYTTNTLDNVFDYSVNKLTTSELYTWTQQTAIFTGVQTMTSQLGINNTVIPILLVYWFILSVIYIIIDIILKLFTILTHAIGSKTA